MLVRGFQNPTPCPSEIHFGHSDFAMKCSGNAFFVSFYGGKTWQVPYQIPDFGRKLTPRTDYLVQGPKESMFFPSAFEPRVEAGIQDRAFCVRTRYGAKTF